MKIKWSILKMRLKVVTETKISHSCCISLCCVFQERQNRFSDKDSTSLKRYPSSKCFLLSSTVQAPSTVNHDVSDNGLKLTIHQTIRKNKYNPFLNLERNMAKIYVMKVYNLYYFYYLHPKTHGRVKLLLFRVICL